MTETREAPWMCSGCGYVMDAATPTDPRGEAVPRDGSIALCINCGKRHIRHGTRWMPLTDAEWRSLSSEERKQLMMVELARQIAIRDDLSRGRGGRA